MKKNVLVAAITFNRPQKIVKCINSICLLDIPDNCNVSFLLVENTDKKTVHDDILKEIPFGFEYLLERREGSSFCRNKVINYAKDNNYDYVAMIDDDEFADSGWLTSLIKTMEDGVDVFAVHGPTIPIGNTENFIEYYSKNIKIETGKKIKIAATSNVLIDVSQIANLYFDEEDFCGLGDDTFFFYSAIKEGRKIVWSAESIVYEEIDTDRLTLKYLKKRYYKNGLIMTNIIKRFSFLSALIYVFTRIPFKLLNMFLIDLNRKYIVRVYARLFEPLGLIAGLFINYNWKNYR